MTALRIRQAVCLLLPVLVLFAGLPATAATPSGPGRSSSYSSPSSPVANFTASVNRLVTLLAVSGSGLLALVWARVALSWFSNDVTKKIQAKDRARDALIGTLLFTAALSGLIWGLAHWIVTGS